MENSAEKELVKYLHNLIAAKKYEVAIHEADRAIACFSTPGDGYDLGYSFFDLREFMFFLVKYHITEEHRVIAWSSRQEAPILMAKAYALFELNDYEKAIACLRLALEYNPVSVALRLEIVENYLCLHQYENAEKELRQLMKWMMYPKDIAQFYRRMGYLYTEIKQYTMASICFLWSLQFEKNKKAMDELLYIMIECRGMQSAQEALDEIKKLTPEMVMRSLIVNNIMIYIDDERREFLMKGSDEESKKAVELYRKLGVFFN